jgi:hypothetical protein
MKKTFIVDILGNHKENKYSPATIEVRAETEEEAENRLLKMKLFPVGGFRVKQEKEVPELDSSTYSKPNNIPRHNEFNFRMNTKRK